MASTATTTTASGASDHEHGHRRPVGRPMTRDRRLIGILSLVAVVGLAACGGARAASEAPAIAEAPPAEATEELTGVAVTNAMLDICLPESAPHTFQDDGDDSYASMEELNADLQLMNECGLSVAKLDGGWEFSTFDSPTLYINKNLMAFGEVTGCINDRDVRKIADTRALDGRVESSNGRSSWSYHPDDGLSLICEA